MRTTPAAGDLLGWDDDEEWADDKEPLRSAAAGSEAAHPIMVPPPATAWGPAARRAAPLAEGFHSRGQAQLAEFMPPAYGGGSTSPQPLPPTGPPVSVGPPQRSGPAPALLAFALVVVVSTVAALAYLLVGQRDDTLSASGDPAAGASDLGRNGTDFVTLWRVDGYVLVDVDPAELREVRADMESTPLLRAVFRDIQMKLVLRNGQPVAAAMAFTLNPTMSNDPGFVDEAYAGLAEEFGGTETTVAGHRAIEGTDEEVLFLGALKRDVIVFVMGDNRAEMEPLLVKLLANVA